MQVKMEEYELNDENAACWVLGMIRVVFVIVILMLAPIGILLGMPFPIGLLIVGEEAPAFVPWAWGVNGFFTVLGSIGASILGMAFGFTLVLAFSGACYLSALLAMTVSIRGLHVYRLNVRSAGSFGFHPRDSDAVGRGP